MYITLDKNVYSKNKDNKKVENLFKGYNDTKKYLEDLGYKCK